MPEDKKRFLQKCFNELEKNVESYYETAANSPKFCEATKKRFAENAIADKQKITEIRKKLEKTIKFFNEKDYLERRTDIWPTLFGEEFKIN